MATSGKTPSDLNTKTLNSVRRILQKAPDKRTADDLRRLHDGLLKNVKFFQNVDDNVRLNCCALLQYKSYGPNEIVFEEGDEGFNFYIIIEGSVAVWLRDVSAEEVAEEAKRKAEEGAQKKHAEESRRLHHGKESEDANTRNEMLRKQANASGAIANTKMKPDKKTETNKRLDSPVSPDRLSPDSPHAPSLSESPDPVISQTMAAAIDMDLFLHAEDDEEEEDEEESGLGDVSENDDITETAASPGMSSPKIRITATGEGSLIEANDVVRESEGSLAPEGKPSTKLSGTGESEAQGSSKLNNTALLRSPPSTSGSASMSGTGKTSLSLGVGGARGSVSEGRISMSMSRRFSRLNKQVATLTSGQSFGEVALQTSEPRTATVRTIMATQFVILDRESYMECLKGHLERQQQERLDFLDQIRIFDDWSDEAKSKMTYLMQVKTFKKGQPVFLEDSSVTEVYFVRDGEFAFQRRMKSAVKKLFCSYTQPDKWVTMGLHAAPQPFGFGAYLQGERKHKDRVVCNSLEGSLYTVLCTKLVSQLSTETKRKLLIYSKAADKFHCKRETVLNELVRKEHFTGMTALVPEKNIPGVLKRERAAWIQQMPRAIIAEIRRPGVEGESPDPRERDIYAPEGRIGTINASFHPRKKDEDENLGANSMWFKAFSEKTKRAIEHSKWLKNNPIVMDDSEVRVRRCWAAEEPDYTWETPDDEAKAKHQVTESALLKDDDYQRMLNWKLIHEEGPKPWSRNRRAPVIPRKRVVKKQRESQSYHAELQQEQHDEQTALHNQGRQALANPIPRDLEICVDDTKYDPTLNPTASTKIQEGATLPENDPRSKTKLLGQSRLNPILPAGALSSQVEKSKEVRKIFDPRPPSLAMQRAKGLRSSEPQSPQSHESRRWRAHSLHDEDEEDDFDSLTKLPIKSGQLKTLSVESGKVEAKSKWKYLLQSGTVTQAYLALMPGGEDESQVPVVHPKDSKPDRYESDFSWYVEC